MCAGMRRPRDQEGDAGRRGELQGTGEHSRSRGPVYAGFGPQEDLIRILNPKALSGLPRLRTCTTPRLSGIPRANPGAAVEGGGRSAPVRGLTHHGLVEERRPWCATCPPPPSASRCSRCSGNTTTFPQQEEIRKVLADSPILLLDGDAIESAASLRGGQGVRQAGSAAGCSSPGRVPHQAVRGRGGRSVAAPRIGARTGPAHRAALALLHYAPIEETVNGEPPRDLPVPGSSRLRSRSTAFRSRRVPRTRASRSSGGAPTTPASRCTTSRCRCCAGFQPELPAVPRGRDRARRVTAHA